MRAPVLDPPPQISGNPWSRAYAITITPTTPHELLPQNLTIGETAAWTRLSLNTLYKAIRQGRIPVWKVSERKWLIPKSALGNILQDELVQQLSEAKPGGESDSDKTEGTLS